MTGFRHVILASAAFLVGCAIADEPADTPARDEPRWVERYVDARAGGRLRLHILSEGPLLMVVHGGPGLDLGYLQPGLQPLGASHRLLLFDQRGTGGSESRMDADAISVRTFVEDMERIRDVEGADRLHLMGHSWGSVLAIAYALEHPERVKSLVLVASANPGAHQASRVAEAAAAARTPEDRTALSELMASGAFRSREPAAVREMYRLIFASAFAQRSRAGALPLDMGERTLRQGFTVMELLGSGDGVPDLWGRLSRLAAPTLLVHGSHDPMPFEVVQEMADSIPQARVALVTGAGHFPWIEQPAQFFDAVVDFLEAH